MHRTVPYYEAFPYCESNSFIKLSLGKHQHSVIASFYTVAESLIASSDCMYVHYNDSSRTEASKVILGFYWTL